MKNTLLILLLASSVHFMLSAQRLTPAHWQLRDGTTDSGTLSYLPKQIRTYDDLQLAVGETERAQRGQKIDLDLRQVEWLVQGVDTVLRTVDYEEQRYLVQPIYQGPATLYRTVGEEEPYPYFFVYQGRAVPLGGEASAARAGRAILPTECEYFHPVKQLKLESVVLDLARQINHCLTQDVPDSEHAKAPKRWWLGVGVDVARDRSEEDFRSQVGNISAPTYLFAMPRVSLAASHIPSRALPGLSLRLQMRYLDYRFDSGEATIDGIPYRESHQVNNLYFYPGIGFELGNQRRVEPVLGLGVALVVPIKFYRNFEFTDPQNAPSNFPVQQEIRNGQENGGGLYVNMGLRFNLSSRLAVSASGRIERLPQLSTYRDQAIHSPNFSSRSFYVTPENLTFIQVLLLYKWE